MFIRLRGAWQYDSCKYFSLSFVYSHSHSHSQSFNRFVSCSDEPSCAYWKTTSYRVWSIYIALTNILELESVLIQHTKLLAFAKGQGIYWAALRRRKTPAVHSQYWLVAICESVFPTLVHSGVVATFGGAFSISIAYLLRSNNGSKLTLSIHVVTLFSILMWIDIVFM